MMAPNSSFDGFKLNSKLMQVSGVTQPVKLMRNRMEVFSSSVAAARKVSPNWSLETMTCHSSHFLSIVWG